MIAPKTKKVVLLKLYVVSQALQLVHAHIFPNYLRAIFKKNAWPWCLVVELVTNMYRTNKIFSLVFINHEPDSRRWEHHMYHTSNIWDQSEATAWYGMHGYMVRVTQLGSRPIDLQGY